MADELTFTEAKLEAGWLMVKPAREDMGKAMAIVRKLKPKVYDLTVKEHRKKRSLDANAYAWVLIGKLADAMRIPPTIVYKNAIQNIGGNYEVIPIREEAAEKFKEVWEKQGLGWPCVDMGPSKIQGYKNLRAYYGSSTFSVSQMNVFIDNLIQDCRALDIDVKTEEEIASIMGAWQ